LALSVPLSRFTPRVGGGSAFFVRRIRRRFMSDDFIMVVEAPAAGQASLQMSVADFGTPKLSDGSVYSAAAASCVVHQHIVTEAYCRPAHFDLFRSSSHIFISVVHPPNKLLETTPVGALRYPLRSQVYSWFLVGRVSAPIVRPLPRF